MKKLVKKTDSASPPVTPLRQRAEEIARETADLSPENIEDQSSAEIKLTLHELRVHQIELDMQNEEMRRAQAELEEGRARYFDLYDMAPVGYVTVSEKGLILEANLTAANLLGVPKRKLKEQAFSRFIRKEDQDIYYHLRKQLLETHSAGTGQAGEPQARELRMAKKDAKSFWAHLEATAAQDAEGEFVCRIMISDITGRKQAEEALQKASELLELTNRELEQALAREQQLARTDGLTGLYNRRYFFELAKREFSAALRYSRQLSIILFDADNLKHVNDTFGHLSGDRLLAMVAKTAAAQLRAVDELARYGGDEFIIMLPETSAKQAFPIAERLREQIAALRVEAHKNQFGVTLSIGIAETGNEPADSSVEAVISRADKAMYKAKIEGRNKTVIYSK